MISVSASLIPQPPNSPSCPQTSPGRWDKGLSYAGKSHRTRPLGSYAQGMGCTMREDILGGQAEHVGGSLGPY